MGFLGCKDVAAILLVELLKPGGNIDVVAMHGKCQVVFGTDCPNDDLARVNPTTGFDFCAVAEGM